EKAISLNDGGRAGRDASRAQNTTCSRFVLAVSLSWRVVFAGFVVIYLMMGLTVSIDFRLSLALEWSDGPDLVSSDGCAHGVTDGADNGREPALHSATGSQSHSRKYCPQGAPIA